MSDEIPTTEDVQWHGWVVYEDTGEDLPDGDDDEDLMPLVMIDALTGKATTFLDILADTVAEVADTRAQTEAEGKPLTVTLRKNGTFVIKADDD